MNSLRVEHQYVSSGTLISAGQSNKLFRVLPLNQRTEVWIQSSTTEPPWIHAIPNSMPWVAQHTGAHSTTRPDTRWHSRSTRQTYIQNTCLEVSSTHTRQSGWCTQYDKSRHKWHSRSTRQNVHTEQVPRIRGTHTREPHVPCNV